MNLIEYQEKAKELLPLYENNDIEDQDLLKLAAILVISGSPLQPKRDDANKPQSRAIELIHAEVQQLESYILAKGKYQIEHENLHDMIQALENMLDIQNELFSLLIKGVDTPEESKILQNYITQLHQKNPV